MRLPLLLALSLLVTAGAAQAQQDPFAAQADRDEAARGELYRQTQRLAAERTSDEQDPEAFLGRDPAYVAADAARDAGRFELQRVEERRQLDRDQTARYAARRLEQRRQA